MPVATFAQTPTAEPSSQQIIDALKPSRTRGMRNLGVKQAEAEVEASSNAQSNEAVNQTPPTSNSSASSVSGSIDLAIQFEFNSSKVSPASRKVLEELSVALASSELASMKFRIEGHTDSRGSIAYNLKLSAARADEVRRVLIRQHVAADRMYAIGKGSSQPLNTDNPAAPENRRVRIVSLEQ